MIRYSRYSESVQWIFLAGVIRVNERDNRREIHRSISLSMATSKDSSQPTSTRILRPLSSSSKEEWAWEFERAPRRGVKWNMVGRRDVFCERSRTCYLGSEDGKTLCAEARKGRLLGAPDLCGSGVFHQMMKGSVGDSTSVGCGILMEWPGTFFFFFFFFFLLLEISSFHHCAYIINNEYV